MPHEMESPSMDSSGRFLYRPTVCDNMAWHSTLALSRSNEALRNNRRGPGFAFSAWQQRSHDNATNAKQARATIERDDYWKRREHIFQLLGSKNPGLRLGAVALLAELADSAAHSTLLNETEIQQLQHHIIDTLCLQVRHEGLCIEEEGDKREHTNNPAEHPHVNISIE